MVLCDTNILIYAFNGRQETILQLQEIGLEQIVLSVITVMELYQGMANKAELTQMKKKIKYYDVVEIDIATSRLATELIEKFRLSHGLQIPDPIIGATAVVHQIPLYTYNTKDFSFMPDIKLI
ncbi:type II toxin-antitoxin system VapC family toxin [Olivibacter sitiensis]|uniref:type II toxin-antitoxin system VapC family toxin n=1 Tax=Olivibacter sitiensis TaxID=376470 RepID=UPI00041A93A3|nr:type II toxin-antitoxin system VapC family toxin [Olivibacter sitiensis]